MGLFTVAACFSAALLTGAAEPADTPTNPIPAAINVAMTILRIRFSLSKLSIHGAGAPRWSIEAPRG